MAVINQKPNMNYGVWANNGNIEVPSSEKVELGWVVEKPLNEQMNWLQNRQDSMLQYINQHGIPEWDNRTEYPINAFVARGGVVYKALSQNFDKDPTLNVAIWSVAFASFDNVAVINSIRNEDGYLQHYVRKSSPVLNSVAKGVGYAGQDLSKGVFFDGNNNTYVDNKFGSRYLFNGTHTNDDDVIRKSDLRAILESYTRYNVGDLYVTTSTRNPKDILGYGIWTLYSQGKALVGLSDTNSNNPDWTKFIGSVSGSYQQTVTVPNDNWDTESSEIRTSRKGRLVIGTGNTEKHEILESLTHASKENTQKVDVIQPSTVVAIWLRVE